MQPLLELLADRIQSGLSRRSITDASRWASKYRVMSHPYPGPWTFKWHPWLREMHDSRYPSNIGQKSAQVGFTEAVLNICFYFIDVRKMDVLYVLPNIRPDATDFSSGRFDKALELSPHLQELFSDVKNVGHKRAGYANLYLRGSNSRSQLKSIPVGLIVLDELDEMNQDNVPLALQRLSGQIERYDWKISTPTIPEYGINAEFNLSTQDHFFFTCPSCSRYIELKYPESLVIVGENRNDPRISESHLICYECKVKLPHEDKVNFLADGKWRSQFSSRLSRGFYINQLYAMNLEPKVQAVAYFDGLKNEFAEQEFYNGNLGLTHTVAGARITDEMIEACRASHRMIDYANTGLITMGVDPGKVLHVWINDWKLGARYGNDVNTYAEPRNLYHGTVNNFEELDQLMQDFYVAFCVIDCEPDGREAVKFANRFYRRVRLCRYTEGVSGRALEAKDEDLMIHVDRTSWLDQSLGRLKQKTIALPIDTRFDCREHLKALLRVPKKDKHGNPVTRYQNGSSADHYAHSMNYAEIALPLALGIGINKDIRSS